MKINYIRLIVRNFDESFKFYSEVLGFKIEWGSMGGDYASFRVNENLQLSIYKLNLMNNYLNIDNDLGDGNDKFAIILNCESVDNEYKKLREKGVEFLNEPKNIPGWGSRCVHLRDVEGNLIELSQELDKEEWDKSLIEEDKQYR